MRIRSRVSPSWGGEVVMASTKELPIGTVLIGDDMKPQGIYTRCPHCGMTDYNTMNQGIRHAHFKSWTVAGRSKYNCGRCRNDFYTLTITIPKGIDFKDLLARVIEIFRGIEEHEESNDS